MRERLEAVFPDDAAYKEITDFIEKEAQFGVTRNEILKGSQTYEKFLSNQAGVDAGDIAIDLATGNKMGLLWALKNATSAKFNQPNPKTAAEIIGRTTSPDLA